MPGCTRAARNAGSLPVAVELRGEDKHRNRHTMVFCRWAHMEMIKTGNLVPRGRQFSVAVSLQVGDMHMVPDQQWIWCMRGKAGE